MRRGREGAALYLPSYSDSGHTVSAHFILSDTLHHVIKVFFCMSGHSLEISSLVSFLLGFEIHYMVTFPAKPSQVDLVLQDLNLNLRFQDYRLPVTLMFYNFSRNIMHAPAS